MHLNHPQYHGWSYNSKGELLKAPKVRYSHDKMVILKAHTYLLPLFVLQYETVEGFDKSSNVCVLLIISSGIR